MLSGRTGVSSFFLCIDEIVWGKFSRLFEYKFKGYWVVMLGSKVVVSFFLV